MFPIPSINLTPTILIVIANLIMTIVGAFIGFFSARRISNLNAIHIARTNLRKAFAPALAKIYLYKWQGLIPAETIADFEGFLRETLLNHAAAIEEYRFFVSKSQGTAYQEAWEKYRYEVWNFGINYHRLREDGEDVCALFEKLIHNIIQFTKS